MSKYIRYQPSISRNADQGSEEDHWLKKFESSLLKDAVQPKQVDRSLYDQITSIMNGKGKHSSVAAAVEDMKDRSGLTAYLSKVTTSEENITHKTASEIIPKKNRYKDWGVNRALSRSTGRDALSIDALMKSFKRENRIASKEDCVEAIEAFAEKTFHNENKRKEAIKRGKAYIDKHWDDNSIKDSNQANDSNIPVVIQKHKDVAHTVDNIIETTRGNLPVLSVINKVRSAHQNDVPDAKDWDADDFTMYVSERNLNERKKNSNPAEEHNLGKVDFNNATDIDSANTEAFGFATPAAKS